MWLRKSLAFSALFSLTPQIDIRKDPADTEKLRNTQELIEEKIAPILANLTSGELQKAQEILNLNSAD